MIQALTVLLASIGPLAGIGGVFGSVVGIVLGLAGAGLLLMGLIGLSDGAWRHGSLATLFGAGMIAAGLWLTGALGTL